MAGKRPPRIAAAGRKPRPTQWKGKTSSRRRGLPGWKSRLLLASCVLVLGLLGWAILARHFAPTSNTSLTRFDAIIVLGTPADRDGNPSPNQLAIVTEAVHEYERGVAPRLILSGGAAWNRYVEATVMARIAEAQGVPASKVYLEGESKNTIQNACYSVRIMESHGWHSAEVVANPSHLPRAAIIFSRLPLEWRTHGAPSIEPKSTLDLSGTDAFEVLKTLRYLVWTRQMEQCIP